jgi:RNA 2',3'-cyclic 3'-phosphodiesterase
MPRLFTALEVPSDVGSALALSRGGLVGARWIEPENYHITLRFVGDIDARLADEVVEALDDVSRGSVPISFEMLAWFGGGKPRAIVAKVKPTTELSDLAADHERLMRRLGLAAETRNFTPHVTLARLRGASPARVADYLTSRGRLAAPPFVADRFVLMSARDGVGGGPYLVEAEFPLG